MNRETLEKVASRFNELSHFVATKRVDSMAISVDRRLCMPGDKIEVVKWYCINGPTVVLVNGKKHCIPFSWAMEMGAPENLNQYMPFPEKTWQEILAE